MTDPSPPRAEPPRPYDRSHESSRDAAPIPAFDDSADDPLVDPAWGGDLRALLESVARQPLLAVTTRFEALGLSRRKGTACKSALIEEGLVRAVDLITPSGRTVLLGLTERGQEWCVRRRVEIAPLNGALVHAWWQRRAADLLTAAGWAVRIEAGVRSTDTAQTSAGPAHAFDVVAERDDRRVLLEVETGKSDYLSNLAQLERTPADARAVLWLDPASHRRAESVAGRIRVLRPAGLRAWVDGLERSAP